jgi:actin-like ATPase involved in cell morphogenesis
VGYAIGVDVGTTFTAAAIARGGQVEIAGLGNHSATIPTVVFLREDGELLVGEVAARRAHAEPGRAAREFKRRFGDSTPILLGHTPYSAERLTAAVLRHVIGQVAERQGGPADALAVVHPANWGPYKVELLTQAVHLAGADQARFVTEPEAAAINYAATERLDVGDIVAVYDLGGGTFDAAVLRRTATGFETLGDPQGIERLGGIDFDEAVLSHVRTTLGDAAHRVDPRDPAVRTALSRLREECVAAKEALSDDSEVTIPVSLPDLHTDVRLTRGEFEAVIRPPLLETVHSLRRAIASAGVGTGDIAAVLLAGGSSRIPLVTELVSAELGRPVAVDAHPKHTVASGAARLAAETASSSTSAPIVPPPAVTPPPVEPSPVEQTAVAPVAATVAAPVAAAPRSGAGSAVPPPREEPPRRRSKVAVMAPLAAVAAAAAAIGAFVVFGGGDGGTASDTTTPVVATSAVAPTTTGPSPTAVANTNDVGVTTTNAVVATSTTVPACTTPSGRCVHIDSVAADGDDFVVAYSTIGFEPNVDGGPTSQHIHFFFDTLPLEEAGLPGGTGEWAVWDLDSAGDKIFRGDERFRPSAVPPGATQICAVPATAGHEVDPGATPSCAALP